MVSNLLSAVDPLLGNILTTGSNLFLTLMLALLLIEQLRNDSHSKMFKASEVILIPTGWLLGAYVCSTLHSHRPVWAILSFVLVIGMLLPVLTVVVIDLLRLEKTKD